MCTDGLANKGLGSLDGNYNVATCQQTDSKSRDDLYM